MYKYAHIEQLPNGRWGLFWPDCTIAFYQTYKTKAWATRTLNYFSKDKHV